MDIPDVDLVVVYGTPKYSCSALSGIWYTVIFGLVQLNKPSFHGSFLVVLDEMAQLLGLICFTLSGSILRKMQDFKSLFKVVKIAGGNVCLSVLEIRPHSTALD